MRVDTPERIARAVEKFIATALAPDELVSMSMVSTGQEGWTFNRWRPRNYGKGKPNASPKPTF